MTMPIQFMHHPGLADMRGDYTAANDLVIRGYDATTLLYPDEANHPYGSFNWRRAKAARIARERSGQPFVGFAPQFINGRPAFPLVGFQAYPQPYQKPHALTPLLQITLPDQDGDTPDEIADRHVAPILFALQAMVNINLWHIKRSLKRAAKGRGIPIPPLYASGVRYKEDPPGEENWRDVYGVLAFGTGDCLPLSTLFLRDDYELVPLLALRPGTRIMGQDRWTTVQEVCQTGEKSLLAFKLSNGCTLRCSREHRLFRDVDGREEEIRAEDARIGDDLITGDTVPLAEADGNAWPQSVLKLSDADRAWFLGAFVADGWAQEGYRAAISGQDGKPKEAQKRRVQALMEQAGIATRWHRKYIALNDPPLAKFFETCGHLAMNKRVPSLALTSPEVVRGVLAGLEADASHEITNSGAEQLVYGTTSPTLALQIRVLHRMLGQSVSIRRVDNHGGFGTHPIYRLVPRLRVSPGQKPRRDKQFARIRAISDGGTEMCGDLTTDTGRFWLPESDVVVHNCDQLCSWRVAELLAAGYKAEPVIKYQLVPREVMIQLGYPADKVPDEGILMIHVCVRHGNGQIEDPSKNLGMGGNFTNNV